MRINQQASYLLTHKGNYEKEPIVKMADAVHTMEREFQRNGWDVKISSGGANWLFYGTSDKRIRLKNRLYLECSSDHGYQKTWFTIRSWKLKKDFNPAIIARFIAKLLGSYVAPAGSPTPVSTLENTDEV